MADKYTVQLTSSFDYSVVVEGIKKIKQEISSIHIGEEIANNLKKSLEKVEVELPGLEKFSKQTELSSKEADKYTKLIEKISKAIIAFNKEVDNTDFTKLSKIDTTKLQDLDRQIAAVEDRLKEAKKEIAESFLKDEFKNAKSSTLTNAVTQLFDVKPEQIRDKFTEIENTVNQQVNESVTRVEQVLAQKTKAKDFSSGKKIIEAFFGEDSGVELATKVDNLKEKFNEIVGEYRTFAAGSEEARVKAKELLDLLNNPEYFKNDKNVTPFGLPTQQDLDLLNQLEGRISRIEEILKEKQPIIDADEGERVKLLEQRVTALEEALNSLKNTKENTKKTTEQLTDKLDEQRATIEQAKSEAEAYERQQQALDATFGGLIRRIENSASAMVIFNKSLQIVRQAIGSVKELDAAFTQIAIVSEQSSEQAWAMFDRFNSLAKQYSITTKDLTEGAKLFYQQGLSAADTMKMVEASTVSAALGEVTMTDAANTLTAAIQGYNESAAVAMDYTDKIAQVGAVSAADFHELSAAMEKTASSAYTAGISFDSLLGYLGKMIEVTREAPANLGTAMKTIIARFEDMKKDPMAILEDGVSANKVETALASIGIALRDLEGEFRPLEDVFDELGMKWDSLTRNQQAYIATIAAGSRR